MPAAFPEVRAALLAKPTSEAICVTLERVDKEKEECTRRIQRAFSVPSWKLEYAPADAGTPATVMLVQGDRKVSLNTLLAPGFSLRPSTPTGAGRIWDRLKSMW